MKDMSMLQVVSEKGSGPMNEDVALVGDNLFGVFDGATSLTKFVDRDGKTGGKLAAEIAAKVFSQNTGDLIKSALMANRQIKETMEGEGLDVSLGEARWSTSACVVRIAGDEAQVFQIGDCLMLVIYKDGSCELLTPYKNHDLETLLMWKKLADMRVPDIRSRLAPQIKKVRLDANREYGCLNGDDSAEVFFYYGNFRLGNVNSVVLFTDGFMPPRKDPREDENWDFFTELYKLSGLGGILRRIRVLETHDPNCWIYPRLKQHDDATAIGLDFYYG